MVVLLPLFCFITAGAYIGWDLYREQARVAAHEQALQDPAQQAPKQPRPEAPAEHRLEMPRVGPQDDEERMAFDSAQPSLAERLPAGMSKKEREMFAARELMAATEHFNKGRYGLAADGFELSIAAGNNGWAPVMMLGVCKVKLRKWADGRALVERGLKQGGKAVPAELRALAFYALAVAAEASGNRAEARRQLKAALAQSAAPQALLREIRADPDLRALREDAESLAELEAAARAAAAPSSARTRSLTPAKRAIAELNAAYEQLEENDPTMSKRYRLKVKVLLDKLTFRLGVDEEALLVQEAEKLKREIDKALADTVR
jgi:hypothetical protein